MRNNFLMMFFLKIEECNSKIADSRKYFLITLISTIQILCSLLIPVFINDSFSVVVIIGIFSFLSYIILLLSSKAIFHEKLKKSYLCMLLIIGYSFLINGAYFGVVGYFAIGLIFTCLLPIFYKTIVARNDIIEIIKAFCKGIISAFLVFFVLSLVSGSAFDMEQYSSFLSNPNTFAAFMAIVVLAALFLWNINNRINPQKTIFYAIVACIAIALCFHSNSRTNMLGIISVLIIYLMKFFVESLREKKLNIFFKRVLCGILLFATVFVINFFVFTNINSFITEIISKIESTIIEETTDNRNNQGENVTISDTVNIAAERFNKGLNGEGGDTFTSGRIGIWKDYIGEISFIGHAKESRDIISGHRVYHDTNAHNVYLQVAYSAGLLAGISLLVFMIVLGVSLLRTALLFLLNKEFVLNPEVMFFASAYLCFFVSSITSGGYMIFTYFPATVFWFSCFSVVVKKVEE